MRIVMLTFHVFFSCIGRSARIRLVPTSLCLFWTLRALHTPRKGLKQKFQWTDPTWNWAKGVWSPTPLRVSTFSPGRTNSARPSHYYTLHSDLAVDGTGSTPCYQMGNPPSRSTQTIPGASGTPFLGPTMGVAFGVPPIPRLSAPEDIAPDSQQVRSGVGLCVQAYVSA